jgi:hypothetical protein
VSRRSRSSRRSCTCQLSSLDAARPHHLRLRLRSAGGAHCAGAARAARRQPSHGPRSCGRHDLTSAVHRASVSPRLERSARRQSLARRAGAAARASVRLGCTRRDLPPLSGRRRPLRGDGLARRQAEAGPGRRDRAGLRRRDPLGDRAPDAHRPAPRRRTGRAGDRDAWAHPAAAVHRAHGRACGRGAISNGVRA